MTLTRTIIGLALILMGLGALTGFPFFKVFFSVILIALGVRIIMGWGSRWRGWRSGGDEHTDDKLNDVAIFSPLDRKITSHAFRGGKAVYIFSGGEIDMRKAKAADKEIKLEIVAIFGGAKLFVPEDWNVRTSAMSVIGGFDNKTSGGGDTSLVITGAAVLGGVEIVN